MTSSDRLLTVLPFFSILVSVLLLIFHHEDANTHEKANHQQYSGNTRDHNGVHIHVVSPSGN
jgi:hypothetical protein